MKLKIKVIPEDFIVEEIARLPLVRNGEHGVYLLRKRNWNTVELLQEISRSLRIPFRNFSYGGRKDRHGLTTQYISIKTTPRVEFKNKNCSLSFIGTMDRPMGPDLIEENRFRVTIRKLSPDTIQRTMKESELVKIWGYPNYFDDQRFGSFNPRQGFLAEKVLKKQWNGALKIYLSSRNEFFFEHWKDWEACLAKATTALEKKAFAYLKDHPRAYLSLLQQIPKEELGTHFSAFQAFLWNEMLREIIRKTTLAPLTMYPGAAGTYLFYSGLTQENFQYLEQLSIPTVGHQAKANDTLLRDTYLRILQAHGLKSSLFNKVKLRQAYFKSFARRAVVKPEKVHCEATDDELYKGRIKLVLTFGLPRGSFATMFVKRIFMRS
jgi:tRNA pseudouridine13 synthase